MIKLIAIELVYLGGIIIGFVISETLAGIIIIQIGLVAVAYLNNRKVNRVDTKVTDVEKKAEVAVTKVTEVDTKVTEDVNKLNTKVTEVVHKLDETHKQFNSRMDEQLTLTKQLGEATGKETRRIEEKLEQKEKAAITDEGATKVEIVQPENSPAPVVIKDATKKPDP